MIILLISHSLQKDTSSSRFSGYLKDLEEDISREEEGGDVVLKVMIINIHFHLVAAHLAHLVVHLPCAHVFNPHHTSGGRIISIFQVRKLRHSQ